MPVVPQRRSAAEIASSALVALFPARAHSGRRLFARQGARVIALIRGRYDRPSTARPMENQARYIIARHRPVDLRPVRGTPRPFAGAVALVRRRSEGLGTRRFPEPVTRSLGLMRCGRARASGVELPLASPPADWDGFAHDRATAPANLGHAGAEEALVHWCTLRGLQARPLGMVGYGDEEDSAAEDATASEAP